jgi:predicted RNase H-like HicB family nuclease
MAFFRFQKGVEAAKVSVELPVTFIEEGGSVVAYTPALDLSTAGKNLEEAKEMFNEAVQIFFDDLIESNTVDEVLAPLGWTRETESAQWQPPKFSQESVGVRIPVAA